MIRTKAVHVNCITPFSTTVVTSYAHDPVGPESRLAQVGYQFSDRVGPETVPPHAASDATHVDVRFVLERDT